MIWVMLMQPGKKSGWFGGLSATRAVDGRSGWTDVLYRNVCVFDMTKLTLCFGVLDSIDSNSSASKTLTTKVLLLLLPLHQSCNLSFFLTHFRWGGILGLQASTPKLKASPSVAAAAHAPAT